LFINILWFGWCVGCFVCENKKGGLNGLFFVFGLLLKLCYVFGQSLSFIVCFVPLKIYILGVGECGIESLHKGECSPIKD